MSAVHLNLLKDTEKLSSSPVRLRVMLPIAALLACLGMFLWWIILAGQSIIISTSISSLRDELSARGKSHAEALERMREASELELELEQLDGYRASRRTWGEALTSLAEVMPLKVQLTRLEIPEPPPQSLALPKGKKGPPLWGPTGATESVTMTLIGRTPKETPVISLMESLESETFTNALEILKDPRDPQQSPRVKSFRQDANRERGQRMLSFEIEYRAKERRFLP